MQFLLIHSIDLDSPAHLIHRDPICCGEEFVDFARVNDRHQVS